MIKCRKLFPELSLPQQLILTRSTIRLEAESYYADILNSIKSVLLSLDENTARSINNAIALRENRNITNHLARIKSYFKFLNHPIVKSKKHVSRALDESLEIVENAKI